MQNVQNPDRNQENVGDRLDLGHAIVDDLGQETEDDLGHETREDPLEIDGGVDQGHVTDVVQEIVDGQDLPVEIEEGDRALMIEIGDDAPGVDQEDVPVLRPVGVRLTDHRVIELGNSKDIAQRAVPTILLNVEPRIEHLLLLTSLMKSQVTKKRSVCCLRKEEQKC